MAQPPLTPPTLGFPASQGYLTAQMYNPLAWIYARMPVTVVKGGNTSRANNTFADDPDLKVSLPTAGTYLIETGLLYGAITTAGFKTAWNVTGSVTTSNRVVQGPGGLANDGGADNMAMHSGAHNYSTTIAYGTRNNASAYAYAEESSMLVATGPVTVAIQWAQNTTTAGTPTVLAVGSWLTATRVDQ